MKENCLIIKLLQGYVFVDRDGKLFRHVLNWLRDGVVPTLSDSEYSELLREAEYYQLLVRTLLTSYYILGLVFRSSWMFCDPGCYMNAVKFTSCQ